MVKVSIQPKDKSLGNLETRFILEIIGFGCMVSTALWFLILFYYAFFNGYQATIYINKYNEANAEFIMGIITFISLIYFTVKFIKEGENNRTDRDIKPIEKKEVLA